MPDVTDFSFKDIFVPFTVKKALLFLILIGFLVHFHVFFNGFVWDDLTYIIGNSEIKDFNLLTLVGPNMFNSSGYFRPLPAIYFSFIHALFGSSAFAFHFFQITLHILCTTLLFFIFKKCFTVVTSFILSLIFLIHPINVESVAYIGSTQSQLYLLLGGLAFYLSLKPKPELSYVITIHILLLLAIFTKEVSFLFFIVIYLFRWLNKYQLSKIFMLSSFITISVYLAVRSLVLGGVLQKMHLIPISEISLAQRLLHIPIILSYYPKTFLFPKVLAIDQIWTISHISLSNFILPLLFDLCFYGGLMAFALYLFKLRHHLFKIYFVYLTWFILGIGLLIQIFPLDMTVADRWFYLPFVGLLGMLGIIFTVFKFKKVFMYFLVPALILFSLRTMVRNADWYSTLTLYGHDVKYYANYDIENYLGADLVNAGKPEEALVHFKRSVELLPHDTNIFNIGSVYEQQKDYLQAQDYYRQTLIVKDKYLNHAQVRLLAAEGLSRTLLRLNPPHQAQLEITQLLTEFPHSGSLWGYLAISAYLSGDKQIAASAAANAKTYLPNPTTAKLYQMITQNQDLTPLLK
jgi:protein O-mannosyl-transferase